MSEESFCPGDAALTRLVKKIANERGLAVKHRTQWNGYGYAVVEYRVPADVLAEAKARLRDRAECERRKRQAHEERAERKRRDELARRYPRLAVELPHKAPVYESWDDVPMHLWSKTQWRGLHCRVSEDAPPAAYFVRWQGAGVIPLYDSLNAEWVKSRSGRCPGQLWAACRDRGSDLAHAVWAANRLVKIKATSAEKRRFYALKDRFLKAHQHCLIDGRLSRVETSPCWCGGRDEWCEKCGGSGVYSRRTLYEHHLDVGGQAYCFHSYAKPTRLSDAVGADLKSYGRRFSATELHSLLLTLPDYLRMLAFLLEQDQSLS